MNNRDSIERFAIAACKNSALGLREELDLELNREYDVQHFGITPKNRQLALILALQKAIVRDNAYLKYESPSFEQFNN